eukprot:jgi/Bigna1/88925/estExt_fgenesh1_pg.C_400113
MADRLSKAQVGDLREIFDYYDSEGKGRLSASTLSTIFQGFGINVTEYEIQDMIAEIDVGEDGGTGTIDFLEFTSLMTRPYANELEGLDKELKSIFEDLKKPRKKLLEKEDLLYLSEYRPIFKNGFKKCGLQFHPRFIEEMIREVDTKNQGGVALQDLLKVMGPAEKE